MEIQNGEPIASAGHHAYVRQPYFAQNAFKAYHFNGPVEYQTMNATETVLARKDVNAANLNAEAHAKPYLVDAPRGIKGKDEAQKWTIETFYLELKRRGVLQAGTSYVVVSWLVAQVAELIGEIFRAPEWMLRTLLIALAIGLPIALFVAWVFELTVDGLKRDSEVNPVEPVARQSGRGLVLILIAVLVLAISALLVNRETSICSGPTQASVEQPIPPIESKSELYFQEKSTRLTGMYL